MRCLVDAGFIVVEVGVRRFFLKKIYIVDVV